MEQLVARRAHNPKVVGSSPAPATKNKKGTKWFPFLFLFLMRKKIFITLGLFFFFSISLFSQTYSSYNSEIHFNGVSVPYKQFNTFKGLVSDNKRDFHILFNELTTVSNLKVNYKLPGKKYKTLKDKEITITSVASSSFYTNYKAYQFQLPLLSEFSYSYQLDVFDPMLFSGIELFGTNEIKTYQYTIKVPSNLCITFDDLPKFYKGFFSIDTLIEKDSVTYSIFSQPNYDSIPHKFNFELRLALFPRYLKGGASAQFNSWYKNLLNDIPNEKKTQAEQIAKSIDNYYHGDKWKVVDSIFSYVKQKILVKGTVKT